MKTLTFLRYLQGIFNMKLGTAGRVHYAVIQSLCDEFIMAEGALNEARLEMCLSTATGRWLDTWGSYFSVSRKLNEPDDIYSKRIIKSVISPKCTIPAIKDYITDYLQDTYPEKGYTQQDVDIREPYREVGKYSHFGTLSSNAVMSSGYYTHAVIDVRVPEEITSELIEIVNAVKAAGVKVLWGVYNSYEVVSGFNTPNDAWAAYQHHLQTQSKFTRNSGLVLSGNGASQTMSGEKELWFEIATHLEWYAKVHLHDTDQSMVISKRDLIGLIDTYTKKETVTRPPKGSVCALSGKNRLSGTASLSGEKPVQEEVERIMKITDETVDLLKALDDFMRLSCSGRMSTSKGVLFDYNASVELYGQLTEALKKFRDENPAYYDSVQGPIENGERCMWYVARNKNWVWNTPLMTLDDFREYWEPFEGDEHTLSSVIGFEDAYYQGYITFGDKYQPPIVRGQPRMAVAGALQYPYLYGSETLEQSDLDAIYRAKRERYGWPEESGPIQLRQILEYERDGSPRPCSVIEDEQGPIEIGNTYFDVVQPHDCDDHRHVEVP